MPRILVADGISEAGLDALQEEPGWTIEVHSKMTADELAAALQQADALIVRSASKVTAQVLKNAAQLKVIGRAGSGVDNIDLGEATRRGIIVLNAPDANTISVADHTIAMLLALCRHLPFAHNDLKQGKWEKKKYEGIELEDKVVGVLGVGRIGKEVVRRLQAFRPKIIVYDPYASAKLAKELEVDLVSLDQLLSDADFITLHMPLTPETRGFLSRERFQKMKRGVQLINCARGELIDESALAQALEDGIVSGAALDVFSQEPPTSEELMRIVKHPHVILTPHLAASTLQAQEKVGFQIAVQIRDFLKEGIVRNPVNFFSLTRDEYAKIEPYLILGERLGSFVAQIAQGGYDKIGIEFRGAVAQLSKEAIIHAVLKGVLQNILSENVNIVNSLSLAKERSIEVVSTVSDRDPTFSSLLAITLHTARSRHRVTGTVFERELIRLISFDEVYLDFRPYGTLLFFKNQDTPGVVGKIGTLLGTNRINIASMRLGQIPESGFAIGLVSIDGDLPDEVIQQVRKIPEIVEARAILIP
ncbi:MAG TPA: phosphoglycerate dehydrogenase [Acidobacteriota bacterium]|nr:phosphoglycerate dehydrogenase [Acidobacteriota bacterium]